MSFNTPLPPPTLEEQAWRSQEKLKSARRRMRWLWFFFILSVLLNLWFFALAPFQGGSRRHDGQRSVFVERYLSGDEDSDSKIAVVRLEGIITSGTEGHVGHDGMVGDIREQLRLAVKDDAVKAIILRVDSPGGEVLASDQIYRAVRESRNAKPVICSMGSVAASGGYYAAMGSKWIIADDLTITGSIGVILHTLNYKDLLGKVGVKSLVFKSGKFKDILNGSREPTLEEIDLVQSLIMETHEQFLGIVAHERNIDREKLRNGIADGRIFSGKQALNARLVDQTGTFEDAVKKAKEMARISDGRVFDYVVPFSWKNVFSLFAQNSAPRINLEVPPQLNLKAGRLYYLSFHLF